jgi:glycosyltransferase involved in cell wall biosynthesis
MTGQPRITIVVPSYQQGAFIRDTLQSLVDQQYPNLEVIIQDAGSTDGAVDIAREYVSRYPGIFQLHVERDRGQAHALNRGFARSTGDILGYLNSDDTLLPGCLERVAKEIDPSRGRYIVFGRCVFVGEGAGHVGAEHPASYRSRFEFLAVWKRGCNTVPQPSTFWHRRVYERCGDFDEDDNPGLDHRQWCNFGRYFHFHKVDALWATYRLHPSSVSWNKTDEEWLDIMITSSRLFWGSWYAPLRWRCELSYRWYRLQGHERARHHARTAEQAWCERRVGRSALSVLLAVAYSPRMAYHRFLIPGARLVTWRTLDWLLLRAPDGAPTGVHEDGTIGPIYRVQLPVPVHVSHLLLTVELRPDDAGSRVVSLLLDGRHVIRRRLRRAVPAVLGTDVRRWRGRNVGVEVRIADFWLERLCHGRRADTWARVTLVAQRLQ